MKVKRFRKSILYFLITTILILGLSVVGFAEEVIFQSLDHCSTIIVGKDASVDGSTMIAGNVDTGTDSYSHLFLIPAQDYEPGAECPIVQPYCGEVPGALIDTIPQVERTYGYIGGRVFGLVNEYGLTIGGTACAAITRDYLIGDISHPEGKALIFSEGEDGAEKFGLERAKTAREAIEIMGELCVKYGYAGYYGSGGSFTVADGEEAWVMQLLSHPDGGSAIWAAQRVPDDEVAAVTNIFSVRDIDFDDPDRFMYSDNIKEVAEGQGWWKPGEPFDFLKIFARPRDTIPYGTLRRTWRILDLIAPSQNFEPCVEGHFSKEYPFSVKPDEKVSAQYLIRILRDQYEGTQYDLTKGLAAGPWGCPIRSSAPRDEEGAWERAISVNRCEHTYVLVSREWLPDAIGTLLWYGPDAPHTTVYVPFYAGINKLPEAYSTGSYEDVDRDNNWWAFNFVSNWANLNYSYMIKEINEKQRVIEGREFAMQPAIEETAIKLYEKDPELAREFLTTYCVSNANGVLDEWREFSDHLIKAYCDGYGYQERIRYPAWWVREVDYEKGYNCP